MRLRPPSLHSILCRGNPQPGRHVFSGGDAEAVADQRGAHSHPLRGHHVVGRRLYVADGRPEEFQSDDRFFDHES